MIRNSEFGQCQLFSIWFPVISLDAINVLSHISLFFCLNIFGRWMLRSGRASSKSRCTFNFDKYCQITFLKKGYWLVPLPLKEWIVPLGDFGFPDGTCLPWMWPVIFSCIYWPFVFSFCPFFLFSLGMFAFSLTGFQSSLKVKEFDSWTMLCMLDIFFPNRPFIVWLSFMAFLPSGSWNIHDFRFITFFFLFDFQVLCLA